MLDNASYMAAFAACAVLWTFGILLWFRQLCKNNRGILCGVHMPSGYWTLEKDFGETLVAVATTTKRILPSTRLSFLVENRDGVKITMLVLLSLDSS